VLKGRANNHERDAAIYRSRSAAVSAINNAVAFKIGLAMNCRVATAARARTTSGRLPRAPRPVFHRPRGATRRLATTLTIAIYVRNPRSTPSSVGMGAPTERPAAAAAEVAAVVGTQMVPASDLR
jgi:hypothetical protein